MPKGRPPNVTKSPRTPPYRALPSSQPSVPSTSAGPAPTPEPEASPSPTTLMPLPELEAFLDFDLVRIRETIRRNDLNASSEEIYKYVIGWIENDESRHTHLLGLLLDVRLIFLPYDFLNDVVESHPLIQASEICSREVAAAKAYHRLFPNDRLGIRKKREIPKSWLLFDKKSHERPHLLMEALVFKENYVARRRSNGPAKLVYVLGSQRKSKTEVNSCTMHSVEYLDPKTKTCENVADIPHPPKEGFAAAAFGEQIWIAGGHSDESGYHSSVHVYNPVTNGWISGPLMNTARLDLGLIEYNGQLYAIGGVTRPPPPELTKVYTATTEVLKSPESTTWEEGASLRVARARMGVAVLKRRLYVLGGEENRGREQPGQMEYFCSVSGLWTKVTEDLPLMSDYRGLFVHDDMMYIVGFHFADGNHKYCHAYNSLVDGWIKLERVRYQCVKADMSVAQVDGRAYLFGGSYRGGRHDSISMFDIENGEWESSWTLCNSVRAGAKTVVLNDHRQLATPSVQN